jgi:hypothetical protein
VYVFCPLLEVNLPGKQFPQRCVVLRVMTLGKVVINCDKNLIIAITLHVTENFDLFHEGLPSAL